MSYQYQNRLINYQFDDLFPKGVVHGVFSRKGGVSPKPWDSLNLGGTVGDLRENVIENRKRIFSSVRLAVETIFDVWQVHSADVIRTDSPRPLDQPHQKADAIITNRPGVTLFMRFADCVPVLFYDPEKHVIGIAHAGWKGTVNKIAVETVTAMKSTYGCQSKNIRVGIGPSIGVDHYEIGPDVIAAVRASFGNASKLVLTEKNGSVYFDLWEANRISLEQAGVESIHIAGICTACDPDNWFSHRVENGKTGRFGALIALRERD